jgi:hypothetical protein
MAAAAGRSTSAKMVHASQIFSQAHRRANFMGRAKVALAIPATVTKISPDAVPVTDILFSIADLGTRCGNANTKFTVPLQ